MSTRPVLLILHRLAGLRLDLGDFGFGGLGLPMEKPVPWRALGKKGVHGLVGGNRGEEADHLPFQMQVVGREYPLVRSGPLPPRDLHLEAAPSARGLTDGAE